MYGDQATHFQDAMQYLNLLQVLFTYSQQENVVRQDKLQCNCYLLFSGEQWRNHTPISCDFLWCQLNHLLSVTI